MREKREGKGVSQSRWCFFVLEIWGNEREKKEKWGVRCESDGVTDRAATMKGQKGKGGKQKRRAGGALEGHAGGDYSSSNSSRESGAGAGTPGLFHALVSKRRDGGVIAPSAERAKDTDRDYGVLAGGFPCVLLNAQAMERAGLGLGDLVYLHAPPSPSPVAVAVALPSQFTLRDCL